MIKKSEISLKVDQSEPLSESIRASQTEMDVLKSSSNSLFVGGVNTQVLVPAMELWHFRNATSFKGIPDLLFLFDNILMATHLFLI